MGSNKPPKGTLIAFYFGFAVAVTSLARAEDGALTDMQRKALDLSLQEYHKKDHVVNAFALSSMLEATETGFSKGTFVRLQFVLKQTVCQKQQWQRKDCKTLRRPKRLNCVTCYKIEPEKLEVVSHYLDCIPELLLQPEREEGRRERCSEVQRVEETGLGFPGSFSFSRAKPR